MIRYPDGEENLHTHHENWWFDILSNNIHKDGLSFHNAHKTGGFVIISSFFTDMLVFNIHQWKVTTNVRF